MDKEECKFQMQAQVKNIVLNYKKAVVQILANSVHKWLRYKGFSRNQSWARMSEILKCEDKLRTLHQKALTQGSCSPNFS